MEFRTKIPIARYDHPIDYNSHILSLGSCFAVNIADKFSYYKFRNTVNPIGILFHSDALEKFIVRALDQRFFDGSDVFFHNERWHCFESHSQMSHVSKQQLLDSLNEALVTTQRELLDAKHLIITLGTAWVYRFNETAQIVSNCHKVPQKQFTKHLLGVDEVSLSLRNMVSRILAQNTSVKIICTVSPVRHIKDGFVENQRSKAHLITALHEVMGHSQNISYFPSYEIMMDELRDYRFYADDMLHPSASAVTYIWERFADAYLSNDALLIKREIGEVMQGLNHIPFNPASAQHLQFRQKLVARIDALREVYPHLNFD